MTVVRNRNWKTLNAGLLTLCMLSFLCLAATSAFAQKHKKDAAAASTEATPGAETAKAVPPCEGLPPGHHALLERMTAAFGLSCEQELKIEPLLHAEESVSKPLLAFAAFSPEEKGAMMQKVKIAARKQILPLLTPDQQKKMEEEIQTVANGGGGLQKGNKKPGGSKKAPAAVDPFDAEEALCQAISKYDALTEEQKKEMALDVKKAARREGAPQLTPEQQQKIDADIQQMSAKAGAHKGKKKSS